jgi:hypothetical protein
MPTPLPTAPTIPENLLNLPSEAHTQCPEDAALRQSPITLWRYAARPASDPSDANPDRGGQVGQVEFCKDIMILAYEWSGLKQEFWILIDDQSGEQGWLSMEFVEFD